MRSPIAAAAALALILSVAALGNGPRTFRYDRARAPSFPAKAPSPPPTALEDGWMRTRVSRVRKVYYQGITSDPEGSLYFDGIFSGLYRTDARLRETRANEHVIPADVRVQEGYNHIGDISWDNSEGGRLLLPVTCQSTGTNESNVPCNKSAIAVADPRTLGGATS